MFLGEGFPYTNYHDLNLDWIVSIVKDFKTKYPDIINELNLKLNKPVLNPDGSLNDVLISNGDGTTKWGTIADLSEEIIMQAVYEWLDEHPEATTTVQDESITMQKLTKPMQYMVERNQSGSLTPVYIGDYICNSNYVPSSIVRRGDNFIVINAPTREYAIAESSGDGYIQTYSLTQNTKIDEVSRLVGHGNSIAFDGTNYYVVPIWEYSNNEEIRNKKVYVYDTNFILLMTLEAPVQGTAISYDPVKETLYFFSAGDIYIFNSGSFTFYSSIRNFHSIRENIILSGEFNQDIAIYNDEIYISSPKGSILHGKMEEGYTDITDSFYVNYIDSTNWYQMGELEGFEFDSSGHLYALMYTNIGSNNLRNAFVVELPVNHAVCTSPVFGGGLYTAIHPSMTLSEETIAKFHLYAHYEIRSMCQLELITNMGSNRVTIPTGNNVIEPYPIRIVRPTCLALSGSYTCEQFQVLTPTFAINANTSTHQLTITKTTDNAISVTRTGIVIIDGQYPLNISTPNITDDLANNFIGVSYSRPLVIIRLALNSIESYTLKCGSRPILQYSVFTGGTDITRLPSTFKIRTYNGYITSNGKMIRLFFKIPKPFSGTPTITGSTLLRGITGYVDSSINMTNTTNYNFTLEQITDYEWILTITKRSGEVFTNAENNTPVIGDGELTFTTI